MRLSAVMIAVLSIVLKDTGACTGQLRWSSQFERGLKNVVAM